MKKIYFILFILLTSCEQYVTETSNVTLSGKYVVSKIEITGADQNQTRDSLYSLGSFYVNNSLPSPFDSIKINNFYIHMDYSTIRLNQLGVYPTGGEIWEYGSPPNQIFYRILGNNSYNSGYLRFDYITEDGSSRTLTFLIEEDGIESLQLKSSGTWFASASGEKQLMTLSLTRTGP
jgi:hypothetical protein